MKKSTILFLSLFTFCALHGQSTTEPLKRNHLYTSVAGSVGFLNLGDTVAVGAPRLGAAAYVGYQRNFKERFFIKSGFGVERNTYYDNLNRRSLREVNYVLSLDFNIRSEKSKNGAFLFAGLGTQFRIGEERTTTLTDAVVFKDDQTFNRGDEFVALKGNLGLMWLGNTRPRTLSLIVIRNVYATNQNGSINTNTVNYGVEFCQMF